MTQSVTSVPVRTHTRPRAGCVRTLRAAELLLLFVLLPLLLHADQPAFPKLVIAHHMNAALPGKAGGQSALSVGSNTPALPWAGPDERWSELGGRVRDMSLTTLYGISHATLREQAAWEIAVAQRAGIDAFAFYGVLPTGEERVRAYMQAAQDTGFKITFCSGGGERDDAALASLRRLVEMDQEHGVLLRIDGKLLLLTYGGNWGDSTEAQLATRHALERQVGTPMLVLYAAGEITCAGHIRPDQYAAIHAAEHKRLGALLDGGFDGLCPFMVASGDRAEADLRFYADVCREHDKLYIPPVNFQFHSPKYMTHAPLADANWRRAWDVAQDGADGVQLLTWNDWGETTALAPGVSANYALYDMLRAEIATFKSDASRSIDRDQAWVLYYRYPSHCEPALYKPPTPRKFRGPEHDHIWVRTSLTAPATVVCQGRGERQAPAGQSLVAFPLTPGPVQVTIRRAQQAVLTLSPPEVVTDRPWRADHSLAAFASDAKERAYRAEDFPNQPPRFYSEYGDDDNDGLLNWFEGLYFSALETPVTPIGPKHNFNGTPCALAQRNFQDPILPDAPPQLPLDIDLSSPAANFATAVYRQRYHWNEELLCSQDEGIVIGNPGDRRSRAIFAFYDPVPNATYGPLCGWGDVTVSADIRFAGDTRAGSHFYLLTRVAPRRQAMYFLRVQLLPDAGAVLTLGWLLRPRWQPAQERVFASATLPRPADGVFRLSLTAHNTDEGQIRLTGASEASADTEAHILTALRTPQDDGISSWGEIGFGARLHEGPAQVHLQALRIHDSEAGP